MRTCQPLFFVFLCSLSLPFSSHALSWPDNYGWRVAAMGGAALAIEDETTEVNLFNLQNPAGLILIGGGSRIDLALGVKEDSEWGSLVLDGNGEHVGLLVKIGEQFAFELPLLRVSFKLPQNLAFGVSTLVLNTRGVFLGRLGLGWSIERIAGEDSSLVLGFMVGGPSPWSYANGHPMLGAQAIFSQGPQTRTGLLGNYRQGFLDLSPFWETRFDWGDTGALLRAVYQFSHFSQRTEFSSDWGWTPQWHPYVPVVEETQRWQSESDGLEQSLSLNLVPPIGSSSHEVALGIGLKTLDERFRPAVQVQAAKNDYLTPVAVGLRLGVEFLLAPGLALRGGYSCDFENGSSPRVTDTTLGLGWSVTAGFDLVLFASHLSQWSLNGVLSEERKAQLGTTIRW